MNRTYRGRLAPSPTGFLHLGHAKTFWIAQERAAARDGTLILRSDDLDRARCREQFSEGMLEDLQWFGFRWTEGPDVGGPFAPYRQSERMPHYLAAFERLRQIGAVYPCFCSRQDILRSINAPHASDEEPVYPGNCRPLRRAVENAEAGGSELSVLAPDHPRAGVAWRFHVPDGETISFEDGRLGMQQQVSGRDFGDFVIWRKDDLPAYQLACVVDDAAMQITEVVRGEDLVTSTFRQILVYRALGFEVPSFYHCELMTDAKGQRLAKRDEAKTLRTLRAEGRSPEELRAGWMQPAS